MLLEVQGGGRVFNLLLEVFIRGFYQVQRGKNYLGTGHCKEAGNRMLSPQGGSQDLDSDKTIWGE
jgi:hypothetical protein